jgi:hypothetical protein
MIERLHRQLKAALMCNADEQWTEGPPLVLMGIRSASNEDLKVSSVELVYGSPLRLPGGFLAHSPAECIDVNDFESGLRVHIGKLLPIPASRHFVPSTFIFKDLDNASNVFLWKVPTGSPLSPYVGPYKVLHRGDKTYSTEVHGAATSLKPAYVLHVNTEPASPSAIPSSITTRSGRRVGFPDYLECSGLSGRGWYGGRH